MTAADSRRQDRTELLFASCAKSVLRSSLSPLQHWLGQLAQGTKMAVAKLTKSLVERLPPGSALWDTEVKGFGVRRQTAGAFFYLRCTIGGRQRMKSIGRFGSPWTVEQARRHALQALGQVVGGDDPFAQPTGGDTFAELVEAYLDRKDFAYNTRRNIARYLAVSFRSLASRPITEIARRDIAACLAVVEKSGAVTRNRARAAIAAFFNWLITEGHVEVNPALGTGKAEETSRSRVLSDPELAAVWHALPPTVYGDVVRLLVLTGQRRMEIGGLRWSEIDFAARVINLPASRTKNGRAHQVPLSEPALAILAARRAMHCIIRDPSISANGNGHAAADGLVFGTTGQRGYNGWSDGKLALDRRLPAMPPFVIHDLRRSVASGMARLGVNLPVIERLLNHVSGSFAGIVGVYQRHDFANEKREALDAWAKHLAEVVAVPAGPPVSSKALAPAEAVA
jgi:integrase